MEPGQDKNVLKQAGLRQIVNDLSFAQLPENPPLVFGDREILSSVKVINDSLNRFECLKLYEVSIWPPLWLSVERETLAELRRQFPGEPDTELEVYHSLEMPEQKLWLRIDLFREGSSLTIRLPRLGAELMVDFEANHLSLPLSDTIAAKVPQARTFAAWLTWRVKDSLEQMILDPQASGRILAELPYSEQRGRIRGADYWAGVESVRHFIRDELSDAEKKRFLTVADRHNKPQWVRGLCAQDFLKLCGICYEAAGYEGLAPRLDRRYLQQADGRHGGLLDISPTDPGEFRKWIQRRVGGDHPWEIVRGRQTPQITLEVQEHRGLFNVVLGSTPLARAAEFIRMANGLAAAKCKFQIRNVEMHKQRVQGADWIGLAPFYEMQQGEATAFFRQKRNLYDLIACDEILEHPQALKAAKWFGYQPWRER